MTIYDSNIRVSCNRCAYSVAYWLGDAWGVNDEIIEKKGWSTRENGDHLCPICTKKRQGKAAEKLKEHKRLEKFKQEESDKQYQYDLDHIDDTPEMEQQILNYLSKGRRG
jgi:hypothetical protein